MATKYHTYCYHTECPSCGEIWSNGSKRGMISFMKQHRRSCDAHGFNISEAIQLFTIEEEMEMA